MRNVVVVSPERAANLRVWMRQLRCHQWTKNLLLLVPLILAHKVTAMGAVASSLLAVITFSLVASSAYVLNDLVDLPYDRQHPRKNARPIAAGEITIAAAVAVASGLMVVGLGSALVFLPVIYFWMLVGCIGLNFAYSLWLKRVAIVDVLLLAGFYVYRVLIGAVAIQVEISYWLLAFSMFFFLGLGMMKRFAELVTGTTAEQSAMAGRSYAKGDLEYFRSFGTASSCVAVLVLALYLQSHEVTQLYAHPQYLWFVCPLVLYWIMRAWLVAQRGEMPDDPIAFAVRDPASYVTAAVTLLLIVLAS